MRKDYGISIDWEEVHGITHGLHDNPHHILGPHMSWETVTINAYCKDALKVDVVREDNGEVLEMRPSGIADFFILVTDDIRLFPYRLRATYRDGSTYEYKDPYSFDVVTDPQDIAKFYDGTLYDAYKIFGAHEKTVDGVKGVLFLVWAPNAQRVSVLGEWNQWTGTRGLMRRLNDTGVFELFVPEIGAGEKYKFEIRTYDGGIFTKMDPYGFLNENYPSDVSEVAKVNYRFKDGDFVKARDKKKLLNQPVNVLEVNLFTWNVEDKERNFKNLAASIAEYAHENSYTHIQLMPVNDTVNGQAYGYEPHGFYSVSQVLGAPEDFQYFVNYMHSKNIAVILDWSIYQFGKETHGLYLFDGAAAYEDSNPLRAENPLWGTVSFNYGRKEVTSFLISNALYWVEKYHVDGLKIPSLASMLYLDYGKNDGQWIPNMYGSNENTDAIELFKHLNSVMAKRNPGVLMIADDNSLYPDVTKPLDEEGLGFDYKWNLGWSSDILNYVSQDKYRRKENAGALTFSLLYAYNEQYMYGVSHSDIVFSQKLKDKVNADEDAKAAYYKAMLGYMMSQPGKKYMYMDQDDTDELKAYKKALNEFYLKEKALYDLDYDEDGFTWINSLKAKDGILVYSRATADKNDTLVFVLNLSDQELKTFKLGVPYEGKYKEIFNSDDEAFGGSGLTNPRMKQSRETEVDGRKNSISVNMAPYSFSVLKFNVAGGTSTVKKTENKTTVIKKPVEKKVEAKATEKAVDKKAEDKKDTKAVEEKVTKTTVTKKPVEKKAESKKVKKSEVSKKVEDTVKKTADKVKKAEVSKKVEDTVKKTADKVKKAEVSKKVEDTVKKTADKVKKASDTVKKSASKSKTK